MAKRSIEREGPHRDTPPPLTAGDAAARVAARVVAERAEQGLTPTVVDPTALARIASIVANAANGDGQE